MTNWVVMIFGMMKHGISLNMPTKPTLYFVKNVVLSELFQESFNYELHEDMQHFQCGADVGSHICPYFHHL
jgi:hypothetical protein